MRRKVFITVAEVSGDTHAAELIRSFRQVDLEIQVDGIGGQRMANAGANIVYESVGNAAMGWRGALRAVEVIGLLRQTRKRYEDPNLRPDLHICIDSSAMNLPFAKMAKSMHVPVLYYVAPQLWASREGRMKKLRADVDRVACILPFEEQYYRQHGIDATFVGHPLFDELPDARERETPVGPRFPDAPPVIGIVPGSRRSEVIANLPHLLEVADAVLARFPAARFLIPTTGTVDPIVAEMLSKQRDVDHFEHAIDSFDRLIPQCDLCLCKSGTSTLHVAAYAVPMIVVYRMSPLMWHGLARWVVKTKKIALVNILAGNIDLVPEFVPWYGSNDSVIQCALELLRDPSKLTAQKQNLRDLIRGLDRRGASMNTAKLAMEMMNRSATPEPAQQSP
ncbi:MAG: lipid-A-disaccharide synthase [Anaerolineae bacterium]|nr:lipid-A-disaccharide synthase [Phycisphaerae bacterium]